MGYTVPLRFVKVSNRRSDNKQFDVAICATRIVAIMSSDIYQARQTVAAERKAGTLINASGVEKTESVIFMDNGSVVASPLKVKRLMKLIDQAENIGESRKSKRMKIYEVMDEFPDEEFDNEDEEDPE